MSLDNTQTLLDIQGKNLVSLHISKKIYQSCVVSVVTDTFRVSFIVTSKWKPMSDQNTSNINIMTYYIPIIFNVNTVFLYPNFCCLLKENSNLIFLPNFL